MTDLLEKAVETVRRMPVEAQNDIARAIFELARIGTTIPVDPDHLDDVRAGLADLEAGDIATEAEVEAAFRRFTP